MAKRYATREAALSFIDTLPMNTVRQLLADYLTTDTPDKVIITEEQFKSFFRIKGYKETGEVENRGRKTLPVSAEE